MISNVVNTAYIGKWRNVILLIEATAKGMLQETLFNKNLWEATNTWMICPIQRIEGKGKEVIAKLAFKYINHKNQTLPENLQEIQALQLNF